MHPRLAEDRQKRALEEWQTEREKESERFKLDNVERWRESARLNERRHTRLETIEAYVREISAQVEALWEFPEAWADSIMVGPREWLATWDALAKKRPPMPDPLKPASLAPPEDTPRIRPLPSAHETDEDHEET